jgi:ATP-dependent RNA helicase RhlE
MLDMGFIHDIKRILELLPEERQSLLFSATFTPHIRTLAEQFLRDPASVDAAPRNAPATPIRQLVHPVDRGQKRHLLSHLVRTQQIGQALVFTRTKRGANRLAEQLDKDGIRSAAIHGNKSQPQRVRALAAFKKGHAQVLVATDVAARGLDIEALPHVVNFELPTVPEDYVHRIGRTGRAGVEGTAISLVSHDEHEQMRDIEKLLKKPIQRQVIEGFEPSTPLPSTQTQGHGGSSRPRHGRAERRAPWQQRGGETRSGNAQGRGRPEERRFEVEPRSGHGRPVRQPKSGSAKRDGRPAVTTMPGERIAGGHAYIKPAHGRGHHSGGGRPTSRHRGGRARS